MCWDKQTISECAEYLQRGKSPKYSTSGSVRIINQKCIRWNSIDFNHARYFESEAAAALPEIRFLQPGDVLINSTGEGTIGRANVWVNSESHWVVDSHVTIVRPSRAILDSWWLKYWIESPEGQDFITGAKTGATKQTELSAFRIKETKIPCPPIDEQQRIVGLIKESMERMNELAELFRSQQDDFTELKLSLVLGTSSEHTEWARVGELVDWIQESEPVVEGSTYQFAGMRSFGNGIFHNSTKGSADFAYKSLRRLKYRDFIYPKLMAWEGAFGMVTQDFEDYVVSPEFVVFRPKNGAICPEVLDTYFRSPYCLQQVRDASTGTNRRRNRLNPKAFLTLQMPFPSIEKQRHLVEVYRIEEEAKRDWKDRQEGLAALRESILHKAFSGEF